MPFCLLPAGGAVRAEAVEPLRHPVPGLAEAFVPYAANRSVTEPDPRITCLVFSFHGRDRIAGQYVENVLRAAESVDGAAERTLVIAPQLFSRDHLPDDVPEGMLYWKTSPFRGSAAAETGPRGNPVRLSAFALIDAWAEELLKETRFTGIREVVFAGHSGGGQLVQRYALVGGFEPGEGIGVRYVVSAPSSYAYASPERFDRAQGRFAVPDAAGAGGCPEYDRWGYGFDEPYAYFADADPMVLEARYAERRVFYLCGSEDADPNHPTLSRTCESMLQGEHRLDRMLTFRSYLRFRHGRSIAERHRFAVVPERRALGRGDAQLRGRGGSHVREGMVSFCVRTLAGCAGSGETAGAEQASNQAAPGHPRLHSRRAARRKGVPRARRFVGSLCWWSSWPAPLTLDMPRRSRPSKRGEPSIEPSSRR